MERYGTITQKKVLSTSFILVRDLKLKNSERFAQIQYYCRDFRPFCCMRIYDTSRVLNLGTHLALIMGHADKTQK